MRFGKTVVAGLLLCLAALGASVAPAGAEAPAEVPTTVDGAAADGTVGTYGAWTLYACGFDYDSCRADRSLFSRYGAEVQPIKYYARDSTCPGGCPWIGYAFYYRWP